MHDGRLLLKAILANPQDDAPRMMFADWLQEGNDPEDAWLGRFIAAQLAGVPWEDKLLLGKLIGYASLELPTFGVRLHHSSGLYSNDAVTYWNRQNAPHPLHAHPVFDINRGFVVGCEMTQNTFVRIAGSLFARHPVEFVTPYNTAPLGTPLVGYNQSDPPREYSWSKSMIGYGGLEPGSPWRLVPALFDLIEGYDPKRNVDLDASMLRIFHSREEAVESLLAACRAYGRRQADAWLLYNSP